MSRWWKLQRLARFSCSLQPRNACRRRYRCLQLLGNNKRGEGARGDGGPVLKFPDIVGGQTGGGRYPIPCNFSLSLSVNNVQPSPRPPKPPIFFPLAFLLFSFFARCPRAFSDARLDSALLSRGFNYSSRYPAETTRGVFN